MRSDAAVSEVVGSILLISLVVLAIVIIGTGFLSQPPPVETQQVYVLASYDDDTLYLYHDGGDDLVAGEFYILLDDGEKIYPAAGELPWKIGSALSFQEDKPERIQIVSTRGGQQNLIQDIRIIPGAPPIPPVPTPTPTPTPTPGQCTQEELDEYLEDNYVEHFSNKLNEGSIYFTRVGPGNSATISGWINFTITNDNSYIIHGGTTRSLTLGDRLSVHFKGHPVRIFSVGNKGWTFSGEDSDVFVNNAKLSGDLDDSWITSFGNFESSLTFIAGGMPTSFTRLIIQNTTILDDPSNNEVFSFINIRPAEPTLMILNFPGPGAAGQATRPIQFIGMADRIIRGSTQIFP